MAVFAIMSEEPEPKLREAVERAFPEKHWHWSDTVSFVIGSGAAAAVSKAVGIVGENEDESEIGNYSAIVTQISPSYWGWTDAEFWLWLTDAFQRESR